jgi:tetratricopeptide (TPR) repeat protein
VKLDSESTVFIAARADALVRLGRHAEGVAGYDEAIRLAPGDARFRDARGDIHFDMGDYAGAVADYDEAIRLAPRDAALYADRGDARYQLGNYSAAIEDFDDAIRLQPELGQAWRGRGEAWSWLEDYPQAIADFREAVRIDAADAAALANLCWTLVVGGGDLAEARGHCDAALAIEPDSGVALSSRGMAGLRQGRFEDAWKDYDQAIRLTTGKPEAAYFFGRGIAALRLGRSTEGRADLASADLIDPAMAKSFAEVGITP